MSTIPHASNARPVLGIPSIHPPLATVPAAGVRMEECLPHAQRLVILVPCGDLDEAGLARRIWSLAVSAQIHSVLYLSLSVDADLICLAERRLVNLCAITRDPRFELRSLLVTGKRWPPAIIKITQSGDLILIQDSQVERKGLREYQDLKASLAPLGLPVFSLEGFFQESHPGFSAYARSAARWMVPLAVLLLFLFLQISVERLEQGWIEITFQILLLLLEIRVIWFANGLLG